MILDHISIAAIRLPKFTNKGSAGCMQPVENSANVERNSSHNLLPSSIFILLKIKRQNKRKETVKYSGTKQHNVVFSRAQGARFVSWETLQDLDIDWHYSIHHHPSLPLCSAYLEALGFLLNQNSEWRTCVKSCWPLHTRCSRE